MKENVFFLNSILKLYLGREREPVGQKNLHKQGSRAN